MADNIKVFPFSVAGSFQEIVFPEQSSYIEIENESIHPANIFLPDGAGGFLANFVRLAAGSRKRFDAHGDRVKIFAAETVAGTVLFVKSANGGGTQVNEQFISTPAQTQFALSQTPANPSLVELFVDGVKQLYGLFNDYYVVGNTLFWNDTFVLGINTLDMVYWIL